MSQNQIQESKTNRFKNLIQDGIDAWVQAGEIIVDLIDNDGRTVADVAHEAGLSANIVGKFEQLGRRQLMPYLLLGGFPAAQKMMSIPYSDQRRLKDETVSVLVQSESGEWTDLQVSPKNLTSAQSRQVFNRGEIRDGAAQRAYIETERMKRKVKDIKTLPYSIIGKEVVFEAGARLTAKQISSILSQLVK